MITGNSIEAELEDALCDYIGKLTADDYFDGPVLLPDPSEDSDARQGVKSSPPIVHPGMVPRNVITGYFDVNAIPNWPFILVQLTDVEDGLPQGWMYVRITAGVWDPDESFQGYRKAFYLARKIVRGLWFEGLIGSGNFAIEYRKENTRTRVVPSNEVTHPYYMAEANLCYQLRAPYVKEESDLAITEATSEGVIKQPTVLKIGGLPDRIALPEGWPFIEKQS